MQISTLNAHGVAVNEQQAEERLKRLATDAFDAIDRGEHVTVAAGGLDTFLDSLKAKPRQPKWK